MFNFFMPFLYLSPTSFSGELAFGILQKLIEKGNRYYSSPKREESITDMKNHFSCPKWRTQKFEVFDADENQRCARWGKALKRANQQKGS